MMKRVLAVGGSEDFPGAAFLASIAALRAGAGSVILMAPERTAWAVNALSPDVMTKKLPGKYLAMRHKAAILRQAKTADILLLGNGVGTRSGTLALMRELMKRPGPKVIDADALKALRGNGVGSAILTPNKREWELLASANDIKKLQARNVIIKKGFPTELLFRSKKFKMRSTNKGLEKAGTGDVLAGMCAGYLAQGLSLWDAAKRATSEGNRIAEMLTRKKKGYFFLASDIADEIKKLS